MRFEGGGMMGTAIVAAFAANHNVLLFILFCLFLLSSTLEQWVPLSLRRLPTFFYAVVSLVEYRLPTLLMSFFL